jgi:iron complex outermembrane receptor protein
VDDNWTVQFGGTGRKFEFTTNQFERNNDLLNPTEKEAGVSIASLGQVVDSARA